MLKIKDLKKGEIYYGSWENGDKRCIFKQGVAAINSLDQFDNYSKEWCTSSIVTLRESTLGEKHWLNECIKANKFISYEEAMKTFKPKYEVGKWYKNIKEIGWYSKFKALCAENNRFEASEYINNTEYRLAPNSWFYLSDGHELLTDLSEIQQWLPEGHPDKVSNSLIGRYLKYVGKSEHLPKYGDFFKIQKDESGNNLLRLSDNSPNCGWNYEDVKNGICKSFQLMPVGFSPNEVSNVSAQSFKAGDFVYLEKHFKHDIETEDWSKDLPLNEKLEIISTNTTNKNLWIRFKGYSFEHPTYKFKLWEEPKPTIKEKPMETNNEFKVGEYVITKGYSTDYDGRVLKITKISNGYYYFEILDNGYYNKTHNFDDRCILRRAKLEEIPTKDLSNEELLSIAKTYYPIGTKFEAIYGSKSPLIVEENNHIFTKNTSCDIVSVTTDKGNGSPPRNSAAIWSKEKGFAKIISSPNEIKGIKSSPKVSDEIEIGDCIQYEDGKFYTVESNNPVRLIHDDNISRYYCNTLEYLNTVKEFKLIRKANNTTTLTQTKKDDVLSPKVENKVTVQIIERKIKNPILNISVQEENQSIFVPLIQKETKKINNITIKNFSLTI